MPFPFIGTNVPEGHQGQSVEGMSHGCVLAKLKTGFHRRGIAWSFNADHQPIGGKFDDREDALVAGCVLASYITFDLSPELAQTKVAGRRRGLGEGERAGGDRGEGEGARRARRPDAERSGVRQAARVRLAVAAEDEAPRRKVRRGAREAVHDRRSAARICASSRSTSCPA